MPWLMCSPVVTVWSWGGTQAAHGASPLARGSLASSRQSRTHRTTTIMTSNCTDSRVSAPTVDDIFDSTAIGNGYHQWAGPGGSIRVTADELRPALEAAYDPSMPDWPALLDWDDEAGSFHIA